MTVAEPQIRKLVFVGQILAFAGLAIAATVDKIVGGVTCLLGWAVLAYAVHKLGRLS